MSRFGSRRWGAPGRFVRVAAVAATALALSLGVAQGEAAADDPDRCPVPAPPPVPRPEAPVSMPEDLRISLFNTVWQAVDELYLFEDHNGVDWAAVQREFAQHVLETENAWEFYELIDRMVGSLGDPLTTFVNPLVVQAIAEQDATYGGIGALLDRSHAERRGEVLRVVAVFPGSPAEAAGLRPRDRILSVDGDDCPRVEIIRGPEGTPVVLRVLSPGADERDVEITRARLQARIVPEARRIGPDDAYGYVRLVSLAGQETVVGVIEAMDAFASSAPLEGIVLDVRGTRSGAPGVLIAVLSYFLEGEVGAFTTRVGDTPLEVAPAPTKRGFDDVPLVVLVDDATAAEAEQLAALLQANERALVVGQPTDGLPQGVRTLDFVGGSVLQIVVIGLRLPDGAMLERAGVVPDVPVEGDWAAYAEDDDPYVVAALEALRTGTAPRGGPPADGP